MSDTPDPADTRGDAGHYEIRLRGHLDTRWSSWFDGFTLTYPDDGTTVIDAVLADQSALHGLLRRVCDLGVPLIGVTRTEPDVPNPAGAPPSSAASTT